MHLRFRVALFLMTSIILGHLLVAAERDFGLEETRLVIPQVDYEGAIYYQDSDPLPYLNFEEIRWDRIVEKSHRVVLLQNEYLSVRVLPEMGRVYSMVFRPTGNETLWQNDVVRPGRANNPTGWWLWLGGY